jgi:hypothetical protein
LAKKAKAFFGLTGDHWQIVGAVAGVIGAIAAVLAILPRGDPPAQPSIPASRVSSSPSLPLESASRDETSVTSGPSEIPSLSPSPESTKQGTARLTFAQDGFDLDTISVGADGNTPDLELENGVFYVALTPLNDSRLARADKEPRTRDACLKAWNVVTDVRLAGAGKTQGFGVNSQLCLTTSEGKLASLRVAKIHDSTDANDWWVELDAIVWGAT